jgi:nucleoside-diphosphate-sugar epimerase
MKKDTILLTGAGGHAGSGIAGVLCRRYRVRGLDVRPSSACDETIVGSITDPDACHRAVAGVKAVVTCHMGRVPQGYKPPFEGMDVSMRGTMLLCQTMADAGVKRLVMVSSATVLPEGARGGERPSLLTRTLKREYADTAYPLSKIFEEMIAEAYCDRHGLSVTLLRPSWVVNESGQTKYGKAEMRFSPGLITPQDIGEAVLCCLARAPAGIEAFALGQPEYLDTTRTMQVLNWNPRHRFENLRAKALTNA